jgi:hypothetical protein
MFKRSFRSNDQNRVDKSVRLKKGLASSSGMVSSHSHRDPNKISMSKHLQKSLTEQDGSLAQKYPHRTAQAPTSGVAPPTPPSPIVTLTVGKEGRLFAAHEDVLCQSSFFEAACRGNFFDAHNSGGRRIALPDEEPEVFSAILEYLYKGDYYPRLVRDKRRDTWLLEDTCEYPSPDMNATGGGPAASDTVTVYLESLGEPILRDTVIYCAATRYDLDGLARLALKKQGLQSGIDVATILRSAQYAYANTPDSDSRLRAHYLALIIRCRKTFKRSGTMQAEMEAGGTKLFFDLFVAMCNHLDDVIDGVGVRTPKTV